MKVDRKCLPERSPVEPVRWRLSSDDLAATSKCQSTGLEGRSWRHIHRRALQINLRANRRVIHMRYGLTISVIGDVPCCLSVFGAGAAECAHKGVHARDIQSKARAIG